MAGRIQREIATAIDEAGKKSSAEIVKGLSLEAKTQLAIERVDERRHVRHQRTKLVDEYNQLPLPGFEHLHAFYPNAEGALTKLGELSPAECLINAERLLAEAEEWNVPRLKEKGKQKLLEAAELKAWAATLLAQQEERA